MTGYADLTGAARSPTSENTYPVLLAPVRYLQSPQAQGVRTDDMPLGNDTNVSYILMMMRFCGSIVVGAIEGKCDDSTAKSWERTFETVSTGKGALVAPCFSKS